LIVQLENALLSKEEGIVAAENKALDHAWSYFQLHANQRITVFNYFVILSGVLAAGLAATIQGPPRLASLGVGLGLLLALLSYVFWKFDQRTAFLIKHSEDILRVLEPDTAPVFADEVGKTDAAKKDGMWTYGKSFKVIFCVMGIVGLSGSAVSALRYCGLVSWEQPGAAVPPPARR